METIVDLKEYPELIPVLAKWFVDEWHFWPQQVEEERLIQCLGEHTIPFTLVAVKGRQPVGTIGVIEHDMETRMDLSPWLASLFVVPEERGQGIAKRLITEVIRRQELAGISPLYLFTSEHQNLYRSFGFDHKESVTYRGQALVIMQRPGVSDKDGCVE